MAGAGRIARAFGDADLAARLAAEATPPVAGYLPYNPGPGIYSRLERAIEQMPENVRVQELPGLLKRYKDGVPGWELKETDLDSVIAGRDVVLREELLARVKERSPVYTHKEVVLTENTPKETVWQYDITDPSGDVVQEARFSEMPAYQDEASAIGRGIAHGDPKYADYSQGGEGYAEILLTQPGARASGYGNHWERAATSATDAHRDAVAHARFDTHGDALRINELQSDLGIHNRKMRERLDKTHATSEADYPLPFPLEDAWADLLIKRLALEAARQGHRAIEVASPRAIADKVGGNIENYEHFYGKVVPGALERLGRKMGGLVEDAPLPASNAYEDNLEALRRAYDEPSGEALAVLKNLRDGRISWKPQGAFDPTAGDRFDFLTHAYQSDMGVRRAGELPGRGAVASRAEELYATLVEDLVSRGVDPASAARQSVEAMPRLMRLAEEQAARANSFVGAQVAPHAPPTAAGAKEPRRYLMSDEMRRRLIQQGVGASLLAPLLLQDEAP